MKPVAGTQGYERAVEAFTQASLSLDFETINQDFLDLLPTPPARVLDLGSGVGQNAAALCQRGYAVLAVEPLPDFLAIAQSRYQPLKIDWHLDSLPALDSIHTTHGLFDFALLDGVWHHLSPQERQQTLKRLATLISTGGICALSLRNGPAGVGTHVFPTSNAELLSQAAELGFRCVRLIEGQASKLPNKPDVIWSRVALQRWAT